MRLKKNELYKLLGRTNNASLWKRIIAYLIDSIIINAIIMFPFRGKIDKIYNGKLFIVEYSEIKSLLLISILAAVITLIYWVILEYKAQQTIGKYLMSIHVVSTTKSTALSQIIVRNLAKVSLPLLILDVLYMIITKGHRRYTELLSNTAVVEK